MDVHDLLAASSRAHRRAVAATLGAADDRALTLATLLLDEERLQGILAALEDDARGTLAALACRPYLQGATPGGGARGLAALERHGLVFAFGQLWSREHAVPADLREPILRLGAATHARRLAAGGAAAPKGLRWVHAPLQSAHDAAAIWAYLSGAPARVKADGQLFVKAWPKLIAALPAIEGLEADGFENMRLGIAVDLLRGGGLVRLRVDDGPGKEPRRELLPDGDPAELLGQDRAALAAALRGRALRGPVPVLGVALATALAGRSLRLAAVGKALGAMLREAALDPYADHTDETRALSILGPFWLAGTLAIGARGDGEPVGVRFAAAPEPADPATEALGVCQGDFEVVCLRAPTPLQRARLGLVADPSPGQAHVYRLTRDSVRRAERQAGPGGARTLLEGMVAQPPQNVARSLAGWADSVRAPLRLRTALFLDAGDAAAADALAAGALSGSVVERLGDRLLALDGARAGDVAAALRAAGHELEPGLDRVSGRWREPYEHDRRARDFWAPAGVADPEEAWADARPRGGLVSTLSALATPAPPRATPASAVAPLRGDPLPLAPLDAVTEALRHDLDLEIIYRGQRGTTHRRVTPFAVEDGALHGWCHLREDERSFWLHGIRDAQPVAR